MNRLLILGFVLSLCACQLPPSQTAEDVAREVNKTADKLEAALDKADEASRPVIAGIDAACAIAGADFEGCKKANELIDRFTLAMDKAQEAVDAYRKFTGSFSDAAAAMAKVVELGAEVAKAAVK